MDWKKWLSPNSRAEQTGMFLAGASVPFTFQKTLMPRSRADQAVATGISMAIQYSIGTIFQENIEAIASRMAGANKNGDEIEDALWRRYAITLDAIALCLGIGMRSVFKVQEGENVARSYTRTAGQFIINGAFAGFCVALFQEAADGLKLKRIRAFPIALPGGVVIAGIIDAKRRKVERLSDPERPSRLDAWSSLAMSFAIAGFLGAMATGERFFAHGISHFLSKISGLSERLCRPTGHFMVLGGIVAGLGKVITQIYAKTEETATRIEPAFEKPPHTHNVSGGKNSFVEWDIMSKQGRRFVSTSVRSDYIEMLMGYHEVKQPIRVFAPLDGADSEEGRIELAMKELERTNAFSRKIIMVISPTGTGYVNYAAVEAAEFMSYGDIASVALQYSKRPSVLSLDRVPEGVGQYRLFLEKLKKRIDEITAEKRPRVVLFGESLGAWTSEDAFADEGTDGLVDLNIDRAIWIGTPKFCKWKDQVLGPPREDVDKSMVGVFNDFGQIEAMEPEDRKKLRYVMITHYNDAVAHFGLDIIVREPDWLGDPEKRPPSVPKTEAYYPIITFLLTLIDMKNAANVIPGQFEAKGHDYRKDLARFIREIYDLDCSDQQLFLIERALRVYETVLDDYIKRMDTPENEKNENGRKKSKNKKHNEENEKRD